jgi:thiosulfate dehydrogenase (quinone) large subunit
MDNVKRLNHFSSAQLWMLVIVRVLIGWHFLYEGIVKIINPTWSSLGYLMDSKGLFASFFHSIAANPGMVNVADFLNMWGLTAIGLGLILGCFTQIATIGGIVLLAFYCLSHPSGINTVYVLPSEGSYLWVNKNLIELFTLALLFYFPSGRRIGFDRLIFGPTKSNENK